MSEVKKISDAVTFEKKGSRNNKTRKDYDQIRANIREYVTRSVERDGGKFVQFDEPGACGLLIGGVTYKKRIYFAYLNADRQVSLFETKERYRWLKPDENNNLSVLRYLYRHQRNAVIEMVQNYFNENPSVELFTPMGIKPFVPQQKNDGKGGKNTNKKPNKQSKD